MRSIITIKKTIRNCFLNNKNLSKVYDLLHRFKVQHNKKYGDVVFAKKMYKASTGKDLNLDTPKTFDEKLWWLKLNYYTDLQRVCSDKYLVRSYVESCGLKVILNDLYGVFDDAREIDFSLIPSPCFFKCNHASGANYLYSSEKGFNKRAFIKKFNSALRKNYYYESRERNYKDIKPKIIAEKVLFNNGELPSDYRFLCINGKPVLMMYDVDTCDMEGSHKTSAKRNIYNMDMELLDMKITRDNHNIPLDINKNQFLKMKQYSEILSKPFPVVRCDYYCINNNIYFGELTFYHGGACNIIEPIEWDYKLGSLIILPSKNM